jgi:endoglucanase
MPSTLRHCAVLVVLSAWCMLASRAQGEDAETLVIRDDFGAIVRGDVTQKRLALVFTGDEYADGGGPILDALRERRLHGSFFLTGRFLRTPEFKPLVKRMVAEGHYVGPHSDGHLLYCAWANRKQSFVSQPEFSADLRKNLAALQAVDAARAGSPKFFVPPYEWYNADQVQWSRELGLTLVNFTPGSGSNRDYAKEGDRKFVPSRRIYDDIFAYERKDAHGLNGFLLLLHLGSGRKDPFHPLVGPLCDELLKRGYQIVRVDELIGKANAPD